MQTQQQAGSSRDTHGSDSSIPVTLEDFADNRLFRARLGIPGIYVVDRGDNDSVFFEVQAYFRSDIGRRVIKVIPISNWVKRECVRRAHERKKGEWPQYLPSCVLFGKLDFNRLPEKHFDYLADWADLVLDAVERYNELHPPREHR